VKAVSEFASEFDIQNDLNFSYFKDVFELKKSSELAAAITLQNKSNAIDLLLNRGADTDFVAPLRGIIENSVITNASYKDTLFAIREFVEGNENFDSRLISYSRQIAHDTFAIADRAVTSTYADEIDADWFLYLGDVITTSRAFCKERHGNYYHWKEIAAWGDGKKTQGLRLPDSDGHWQGEIDGTNKDTIFIYAGGYNCRHAINAVSVAVVPKVVLQRNIEQGFYNPV
jgi:hypothetical protein